MDINYLVMVIGIPRALLYYKYGTLWTSFFEALGVDTIVSGKSNKQILRDGISYSIDECCLSSKLFLGHVFSLIGKCDYILIPRIETLAKKNAYACVKFHALFDIVANTFFDKLLKSNTRLLDYNINAAKNLTEERAFLALGRTLGFSRAAVKRAYYFALKKQQDENARRSAEALLALNDIAPKLLVVGHPYNIYDEIIGLPVLKILKSLGARVILANEFDASVCAKNYSNVSSKLYWEFNKELVGATSLYKDRVDGVVLITAFPCGPDSLVNELLIRRLKGIPKLNLVIDELNSEAGLITRLESFCDIIMQKRAIKGEENKS